MQTLMAILSPAIYVAMLVGLVRIGRTRQR
jgi:hypothetical protein